MSSQSPEPGSGLRVATVGGVPIHLSGTWPVLAVLILVVVGGQTARSHPELGAGAYGVAAVYVVLLAVSVLLHEGAHAAVARARGLPVHRIVLDVWGGHTTYDGRRAGPGSTALIALSGPVTNGVLGVAALGLRPLLDGVALLVVGGFGVLNVALALFNLLPGLPFDGGQVVEAGVWGATGRRSTARAVAGWCGIAAAVLVALWFVALPLLGGAAPVGLLWSVVVAVFVARGAWGAVRSARLLRAVEQVRLRDVILPAVTVPPGTWLGALVPGTAAVVVEADRITGVVDPRATTAVPPGERDSTRVEAVLAAVPPDRVVAAAPDGTLEPLLGTLDGRDGYLVVTDAHGRPYGVTTAGTLVRAVSGDRGRA